MARLVIRDLVIHYGSVPALEGVSLEVQPGDLVGVIGPNGAGKSTLLKAIARVIRPDRGCVLLDGEDVLRRDTREVARSMAVVPQSSPISFDFTVLEVVLMGRSPHLGRFQTESERDLAIARRAMERTDCADLADRSITQVSGGEKQRVIIAKALAQEPSVLLLDEPTMALDINHQVEILDLVRHLNRTENVTVLAVLHDLNLASQYCDYLVALREGVLFGIGTPEEVITAENIRALYGAQVHVHPHPISGRPQVVLLPHEAAERASARL
ncbi:MAG: heme ABC transporter ATP-binding protein [Armatimonadota bacterium]